MHCQVHEHCHLRMQMGCRQGRRGDGGQRRKMEEKIVSLSCATMIPAANKTCVPDALMDRNASYTLNERRVSVPCPDRRTLGNVEWIKSCGGGGMEPGGWKCVRACERVRAHTCVRAGACVHVCVGEGYQYQANSFNHPSRCKLDPGGVVLCTPYIGVGAGREW